MDCLITVSTGEDRKALQEEAESVWYVMWLKDLEQKCFKQLPPIIWRIILEEDLYIVYIGSKAKVSRIIGNYLLGSK